MIGPASVCAHCNYKIRFIDGRWIDTLGGWRCAGRPRHWFRMRRLHEAYPQTKES